MSQALIPPTVGRVVLFWPSAEFKAQKGSQPNAALVAYVHSDRMVNIAGFDCNGAPFSRTSVQLVQPGDPEVPKGAFVEWMPYQIGQAKAQVDKLPEAKAVAAAPVVTTTEKPSVFNGPK